MAGNGESKREAAALVVGAGVAGIRAALDLAETGFEVLLTDASPAIGGILAKLDYQFTDDHCGMCKMLPLVGREYASEHCMRKSLHHDRITVLPFTEIVGLAGDPGHYEVTLRRQPSYVDSDACIGTGRCAEVCPVEVPDEFNHGLTKRKAIFRPVPHNLDNTWVVDMDACTRCGECEKVCPTDAIHLDAEPEEYTVGVGSLVFAAGSGLYAAEDLPARILSPNVVTSLEMERLLSGSGTYDGVIHRPSDGKAARRIAWMQCVGSRNRKEGHDFCSSVCCMFALKEAVLAQDKGGDGMETCIFYMDLRAFGKGFYRYQHRAETEHGVRLVRCRTHEVTPKPSGDVIVRYFDPESDAFRQETFDLVVLSVGQRPQPAHNMLAELLGAETTDTGFFPLDPVDRVRGPREGVFLAGSFAGLTDISEALATGSAAAGEATTFLKKKGTRPAPEPTFPDARDVARERPRVGVLLCQCDRGKGSEEDAGALDSLCVALARHPGVTEARVIPGMCHGEGLEALSAALLETSFNRVLLGACFPYVHKTLLRDEARKAGWNPALLEVADLRSLVEGLRREDRLDELAAAGTRALGAQVEHLKAADPLVGVTQQVVPEALVLGGGVAGMRAALSLADRGIHAHLVERTDQLGGLARGIHYTVEGLDVPGLLTDLENRVRGHGLITLYLGAALTEQTGALGRFRSVVVQKNGQDRRHVIWHGATIVATGAQRAPTSHYHHGEDARVLTQTELEERIAAEDLETDRLGKVVMVQCVGSREMTEHAFCSRVCCASALKNAARIREANPEARVFVLYRDLMAYGLLEPHYTRARASGVIFVPYDVAHKPEVERSEEGITVTFRDPALGDDVRLRADLVALSTGFHPGETNQETADLLGAALDEDGFFAEANAKWRPVDSLTPGVFLAGAAHSPRNIPESIALAEAAAERAYGILCRERLTSARVVSTVRDAICSRCRICVTACPMQARRYDPDEDRIVVEPAVCLACGLCVAACPNSAAALPGRSERQTMSVLDAVLEDLPVRPYGLARE